MEQKPQPPLPEFSKNELKLPFQDIKLTTSSSSMGFILILMIVALVAILVGLYFWSQILKNQPLPTPTPARPTAEQNNEPESTTAEANVETLNATSPSDELGAIEADLESTNFESIDSDLNALEAEFDTVEIQ